jgi:hypothetical protein
MQTRNPRRDQTANTRLRDDPQQVALAEKRMGRSPEDRLRWVLRFTERDLDTLRPEERRALGMDLLMLSLGGWAPSYPKRGRGGHVHTAAMPIAVIPEALLRSLQAEITQGLQGLLEEPPRPWQLPATQTLSVSRASPTGAKRTQFHVHWEGGMREAILGSVLNLLLQAGEALRACAECQRPLVARKRQIYCSARCSQQVRDRKRSSRAKA